MILAIFTNNFDKMDSIDLKILKELHKDGRLSNQELAERVSLSASPCLRRVRKLEESGVIKGFTTLIDYRKFGFSINTFISVRLEKHTDGLVSEFEKGIQELDEVMACYLISGSRDYLLQIVAKDLDSYEQFLRQKLRLVPGIGQLESNFVLRQIKTTAQLPTI
jgi:Lrp/AsnC family leucine-responsive transcriptional regulator